MKKKLFLILSIVLVAIMACSMLVACVDPNDEGGDTNQEGEEINKVSIAESPTAFEKLWKESNYRSYKYVSQYGESKEESLVEVCGNILKETYRDSATYIEVVPNSKVSRYKHNTKTNAWEKESYSDIVDINLRWRTNLDAITSDLIYEIGEIPKEIFDEYDLNWDNMKDNFTKNGNTYVGKYPMGEDNLVDMTIVIAEKEMSITISQEYDGEVSSISKIFGIGTNAITIPAEANNGEDVTVIKPLEKMLRKFYSQSNLKITITDSWYGEDNKEISSYAIYGDTIEIINSEFTLYIEKIEDNYNYYLAKNSDAEWEALTLSLNELKEKLSELNIDFYSHETNISMRDIFDKIVNRISYAYVYRPYDIDRYFEKTSDNVFVAKDKDDSFEDSVITISEDKITNNLEGRKKLEEVTKLANAITIPEEAKAVLQ